MHMTHDYSPLFEPIKIGTCEIKNRIVMAPMTMNYVGPNGYASDQQLAYYAARAQGGTGLIITDSVNGVDHPTCDTYRKHNIMKLYDERYVAGMSEMVEHVHAFGAKIFCQIALGPGRQGTSELGAVQPVAASPIPYRVYPEFNTKNLDPFQMMRALGYQGEFPQTDDVDELMHLANKIPGARLFGETPREQTVEEIKEMVEALADSAKLVKRCGFDGLELHACHGYLLHGFISKRQNFRTDEYGGSFENRIRFLLECLHSMRRTVGPDFPIGVRYSASEELADSDWDPGFANKLAKRLEQEGVDYIHLSDGAYERMDHFLPVEEGQVIPKSQIINHGLNIPLICVSVHDPDNALDVITTGKADLISQGRQQIADPEWANKVREGRIDEIVKCTRCNLGCIGRFILGLPCRCIKNPEAGQERFIEKYMRRPILPLKNRVWQTLQEVGKDPSAPVAGELAKLRMKKGK
jgi:dimethylglycine catabolism A